jgi:hypothetical protein
MLNIYKNKEKNKDKNKDKTKDYDEDETDSDDEYEITGQELKKNIAHITQAFTADSNKDSL